MHVFDMKKIFVKTFPLLSGMHCVFIVMLLGVCGLNYVLLCLVDLRDNTIMASCFHHNDKLASNYVYQPKVASYTVHRVKIYLCIVQ